MYTAPQDSYNSWRFYVVVAPVAMFFVSWAFAALVFDLHSPFISTFGTVELLPVASLILLGVSAELENDAIFSSSAELSQLRFAQNLGVILMLVCYGAIKGRALQLLEDGSLNEANTQKLISFGAFSIACTFTSIVGANYSKTRLLYKQLL